MRIKNCVYDCIVFQWTVLICVMVGLNWWMKPVTRATVATSNMGRDMSDSSSRLKRFKKRLLWLMLREEVPVVSNPIYFPPKEQISKDKEGDDKKNSREIRENSSL